MGRRWIGDMHDAIRAGARDSKAGKGDRVDLTDLARSAADLENALERRDQNAISPAYKRLRSAYDAIQRRLADSERRTSDATFADRGAHEARNTRDIIRSMNRANRKFWAGGSVNDTRDPTTAVPTATPTPHSTRTQDWAHQIPPGSPFANAGSLTFETSRTPTVSQINQRNAEFWAKRSQDNLPPAT